MARWRFGLLQDGRLAAVVGFGPPGSHTAFRALLPAHLASRVIQLCRGASAAWAHPHSASHLIMAAGRVLAAELNAVAIAAYSDPRAGELGTVYQACNAIYLGPTATGGAEAFIVHRRRYTARRAFEHFGSTAHRHLVSVDPHARQVPRSRKHRYVIPIGSSSVRRRIRALLSGLQRPYPKLRHRPTGYSDVLAHAVPVTGMRSRGGDGRSAVIPLTFVCLNPGRLKPPRWVENELASPAFSSRFHRTPHVGRCSCCRATECRRLFVVPHGVPRCSLT